MIARRRKDCHSLAIDDMARIEKKLIGDIEQIERMIFSRHRLPEATWERNALLSSDRNELIRFGVSKSCAEIEFFAESLITNYFIDNKKNSYRTKKYRLFESRVINELNLSDKLAIVCEIVVLPPHVKRFFSGLQVLKKGAMRHLSEMEETAACNYCGKSIFDLSVFKRFQKDASAATTLLMNKFVRNN